MTIAQVCMSKDRLIRYCGRVYRIRGMSRYGNVCLERCLTGEEQMVPAGNLNMSNLMTETPVVLPTHLKNPKKILNRAKRKRKGANNTKVIQLVRRLLNTGCDATVCGIRYDECNGPIVTQLKKLLNIK